MFSPQRNAWSRPRGARRRGSFFCLQCHKFQSTRPRGARRKERRRVLFALSFQSTRPRGARLILLPSRRLEGGCFNPRARVGRDHGGQASLPEQRGFQSTRPRGARQDERGGKQAQLQVSIHAPAWGATGAECQPWIQASCFNPRARVGRDFFFPPLPVRRREFQSTRPRGARPTSETRRSLSRRFQSTRPRGARLILLPSRRLEGGCFNPRARVGRDF